jgi:hypothetical protein
MPSFKPVAATPTTTKRSSMPAPFKTIYSPHSAFGGINYRATSNGELVHIQARGPAAASFSTKRTVTKKTWDAFVSRNGLDNPYNDNPSFIAHFAEN